MNKLFVLLVVAFILSSCEKNTTSNNITNDLFGTWQWQRTDGGFAYHIHNSPATMGYNVDLIILDSNKLQVIKNDTVVYDGEYSITQEKSIYTGEKTDYITLKNDLYLSGIVFKGIITNDNEYLYINDNWYDGVSSLFARRTK